MCTTARRAGDYGQGRELGGKLLLESHSAAALASVPLGKVHGQSLRHPGRSH